MHNANMSYILPGLYTLNMELNVANMPSNNALDIQIPTGNEKHVLPNEEFNGAQIISGKSKHVSLNFNALVKLDNISF